MDFMNLDYAELHALEDVVTGWVKVTVAWADWGVRWVEDWEMQFTFEAAHEDPMGQSI